MKPGSGLCAGPSIPRTNPLPAAHCPTSQLLGSWGHSTPPHSLRQRCVCLTLLQGKQSLSYAKQRRSRRGLRKNACEACLVLNGGLHSTPISESYSLCNAAAPGRKLRSQIGSHRASREGGRSPAGRAVSGCLMRGWWTQLPVLFFKRS